MSDFLRSYFTWLAIRTGSLLLLFAAAITLFAR